MVSQTVVPIKPDCATTMSTLRSQKNKTHFLSALPRPSLSLAINLVLPERRKTRCSGASKRGENQRPLFLRGAHCWVCELFQGEKIPKQTPRQFFLWPGVETPPTKTSAIGLLELRGVGARFFLPDLRAHRSASFSCGYRGKGKTPRENQPFSRFHLENRPSF